MLLRRTAAMSAVLLTAATLLTACEKPRPLATVFSGSASISREALCWSSDPTRAIDAADCLIDEGSGALSEADAAELADYLGTLVVNSGQTVGISVDPEVAESGWSVSVNGRRRNADLINSTYFRFELSERDFRGRSLELQVIAPTSDLTQRRGLWVFELRPASAEAAAGVE
jgi:hypothetical protein